MDNAFSQGYELSLEKTYTVTLYRNTSNERIPDTREVYTGCSYLLIGIGAVKFTYEGKVHISTLCCQVVEE